MLGDGWVVKLTNSDILPRYSLFFLQFDWLIEDFIAMIGNGWVVKLTNSDILPRYRYRTCPLLQFDWSIEDFIGILGDGWVVKLRDKIYIDRPCRQ
jgi:hypothetical protein